MTDISPPSAPLDRAPDASKVGSRLRTERERLGISLRELARRVGVSPSLVSQIELDRVNPSVSTLYALVTELGMTMSDVFGDSRAGRARRPPLRDGDGLAERPETRTRDQPRVRRPLGAPDAPQRPRGRVPLLVYPVGAESCPEDALMTHGGKEYGYVTSGTLGVRVGFESTSSGPAVRSRSTRRHRTVSGRSATRKSTPCGSSSAGSPILAAPCRGQRR